MFAKIDFLITEVSMLEKLIEFQRSPVAIVAKVARECVHGRLLHGIVIAANSEISVLAAIDSDSLELDGVRFILTRQITSLSWQSMEWRNSESYMKLKKQEILDEYKDLETTDLRKFLESTPSELLPVLIRRESMSDGADACIAIVFSDSGLQCRVIGPDGSDEGHIIIRSADLTCVEFASRYCKKLAALRRSK